MGQTLSHGVYLPNEGERNCYAGLASNWQILNTAVGAIAEKAPLVHTHAVSQITDFPAYGNAAGTICEGNDSRLSDARTPVAHTHTKSDVTDLLNSNFIPSANNSYNLGSSSNQWNNLYAKNYYYNGVAWGLDKANVWSKENTFTANNINIQLPFTIGDNTYRVARLQILDSAPTPQRLGTFNFVHNTNNLSRLEMGIYGLNSNNEIKNRFLLFQLEPDETSSFFPLNNSQINLGTSTNKWKSLNGINPGALSLPKTDSSITSIGTSGFSFDGTSERIPDTINVFSNGEALMNGWLCARIAEGAGHYIFLNSDDTTGRYGICSSCFSTGVVSTLSFGISVYVPIKAGDKPAIRWAKPNGGNAQLVFYPCFGNV